jgi:hypothetical protein
MPTPNFLTRDAAANALTAAGYPVSAATLATRASRGGGPIYRTFSGRALYLWSDLLSWAESRTSIPKHCTSEADAQILSERRNPPPISGPTSETSPDERHRG